MVRRGNALLILVLLLAGVAVWFLVVDAGGAPDLDPGPGPGPGAAGPAVPPEGPGPVPASPPDRVRIRVRLLSTIPAAGPPRPIYSGRYVAAAGPIEAVGADGSPWTEPVRLTFLDGPAAGREATLGPGAKPVLLPRGWARARVSLAGWPDFERLLRLRQGGACRLVLPAPPPCTVKGRVFGPDGEGLAGARVAVGKRHVVTDGKGAFELDGLVPGEPVFRVSAPGCGTLLQVVGVGHVEPARPLVFLLTRGVDLVGRVSWPDRAGSDVTVHVLPSGTGREVPRFPYGWDGGWPIDERGVFTIQGIPEGMPLRLWARGGGFVAKGVGVRLVAHRQRRGSLPVVIPLRRERIVRGTVYGADGKPLPGARVRSLPWWEKRIPSGVTPGGPMEELDRGVVAGEVFRTFLGEARTDAQGAFAVTLAVPPGTRWALDCLAPGHVPQRLPGSRRAEGYRFELERGAVAGEGPPILEVRFPDAPKDRRVVVRHALEETPLSGGVEREAGQPWRLPLPTAGHYEIRIEVKAGGRWRPEELRKVAVGGLTPVTIKL